MKTTRIMYLKTLGISLIMVLSIALFAGVASAGDIIDVPGDYATISLAIAASSSGDTIMVCPGTYEENIDYDGKDIIIISLGCADETIIDAGASGSVVTFDSGETAAAKLIGFTIQNGSASDGGGITITGTNTAPTIQHCIITNNVASDDGGGIYIADNTTAPTIQNCIITNNVASDDGGGIYNINGSPTIDNCTISYNTAPYSYGGGIYNSGGTVSITDSSINNNKACNDTVPPTTGGAGGGIWISCSSTSTIEDCDINDNDARLIAGGITAGLNVNLARCDIKRNHPSGLALGSSNTIEDCDISDNTSSYGAGIYSEGGGVKTITGCTISGNDALNLPGYGDGWGGGIAMYSATSDTQIINCIIVDNTGYGSASHERGGGGIYLYSADPDIINCTISNNHSARYGGGIYSSSSSAPTVTNSILWDDTDSTGDNEIYVDGTSSITVTYSDVEGGWTGTGNIDDDPDFETGDCNNYDLGSGTDCIDAGTSSGAPSDDICGNTRDGSPDMGAVEDVD
jgi:parallel beta-helix repeat protein